MYTEIDLENARAELAVLRQRWENYSGNNPDKYQSDIKAASRKVNEIELHLKSAGILEFTEKEKLNKTLDQEFPNAGSKEVVIFNAKKYQRIFRPLEKSRSGKTVTAWLKDWVLLSE